MELRVEARTNHTKKTLNKIRHEENIPAVVYGNGVNFSISVNGQDYNKALRSIEKGQLSSTIFVVNIDGEDKKVLIKDIQYHRTTYKVLHIDFLLLKEGKDLTLNVPLKFVGMQDCPGIKLGGFLRPIRRYIKMKCLPKNIPSSITVDVSEMHLKQSKKIKHLTLPENCELLATLETVVVVIGK